MRYVVCSVRDRAADVFGVPMFLGSIGQAIRAFSDEVQNPESMLAKHPEDFDLYFLGYYIDGAAEFSLDEPMRVLIRAQDCKKV